MPDGSDDRAFRHALIAFACVAVMVVGFVHLDVQLPGIGQLGSALIAFAFLFVPMYAAGKRGEELEDYGFRTEPVGKGLAIAGVSIAIIIPVFAAGYLVFYEVACHSTVLAHVVPHGMCARYGGVAGIHAPALSFGNETGGVPTLSAEFVLTQFAVVALPEELFFRGFLLTMLEKRFPPKRRFLGGGLGLALVLSAAAFSLIHLPKDGDPRALATFFPGLLFGWMRSATGSLLASTITHGFANVFVRLLDLCVQR